ncbi:hypothetical protein FHT78_005816 [Rhizobium sp. BK196]|nr:hypothetical protein [Rhizobium sp. BK196]MBB3464259.1 hypothetical protein [Rhizobium sp. BK377]
MGDQFRLMVDMAVRRRSVDTGKQPIQLLILKDPACECLALRRSQVQSGRLSHRQQSIRDTVVNLTEKQASSAVILPVGVDRFRDSIVP